MIITVKTLQQKSFKVEIDESETILTMKKKIEEEQGAGYPADGTRLIYAGKILSDTSTISEYKIQESNFVVVMPSKAKASKTAPSSSTPSAPPSTPSTQHIPQRENPTTSASETPQPPVVTDTSGDPTPTASSVESAATPSTVTVPPSDQPSSEPGDVAMSTDRGGDEASREDWQPEPATSGQLDEAIANLMGLGYERDLVVRALRVSFNNPNMAAEYLMQSMPGGLPGAQPASGAERMEGVPSPQQQPSVVGAPRQPGRGSQQQAGSLPGPQAGGRQPGGPGGPGDSPLAFLRQQPQFAMLREQLQRNPGMLQALLQQIGQTNPQLLDMINANQQAFIEMVNETPGAPPGGQGSLDAPVSISVTQEEKAIIDRLTSMGFQEHLVVQAFVACERNEELTLNFLLSDDMNDSN